MLLLGREPIGRPKKPIYLPIVQQDAVMHAKDLWDQRMFPQPPTDTATGAEEQPVRVKFPAPGSLDISPDCRELPWAILQKVQISPLGGKLLGEVFLLYLFLVDPLPEVLATAVLGKQG